MGNVFKNRTKASTLPNLTGHLPNVLLSSHRNSLFKRVGHCLSDMLRLSVVEHLPMFLILQRTIPIARFERGATPHSHIISAFGRDCRFGFVC